MDYPTLRPVAAALNLIGPPRVVGLAMRKTILLLPLLLAACNAQDGVANNAAPTTASGPADPALPAAPAGTPVQTSTLTGLYESGPAGRRNQMCVVERAAAPARFGLVVWGAGEQGCSGAGEIVRQGSALRLTMAGDEACTFEARIEGMRVSFPAALPTGCAYYCSRGAGLANASFNKTGGSAGDAARAVDLVGDRLCTAR